MTGKTTFLSGSLLTAISAFAAERPNIIYIFTDQQTATAMSCAGNGDVKTPNIDRLAREGVRFTNAYCAAPLSGPSRAAMFTGITPGRIDMLKNNVPLPDSLKNKTLGTILGQNEYDCAYAGKWHLPTSDIPDNEFGFRNIHNHDDRGLAEACDKFLSQKHNKPFFLVASLDNPHNICEYARAQNLPFASITEPHIQECPALPANFPLHPYDADIIQVEKNNLFRLYPTTGYTPEDWRRYRNAYYRLVETVDAEIGKILNSVDKNKLGENTIILFSSDHGDGTGAHQWNQKSALYEEVVNVPFIVKVPKNKQAGKVKFQLVNNGEDLLPTILDYANLTIPDYCHGKSLRSVIEKETETEVNDFVVTETLFDGSTTKGWMVRTPRYKYVLYDKGRNREMLYDMTNDRGEMVNLAIESKYEPELQKHRNILQDWMRKNGIAPVRKGLSHIPGK